MTLITSPYGGLANYQYFLDNAGNLIDPTQYIVGSNYFKKLSQEIRIASPADKPFRVIAGAFYQRQSNDIFQNYRVDNLADDLSVNGRPGTLWLTKQERIDKDYALFGEASFDVTPQITLTAGGRLYKFDNTLFGFAGFGRNPNFDPNDPDETDPPNVVGSTGTGVAECFAADGLLIEDGGTGGFAPGSISGIPCTNVGVFDDGKVKPKRVKDSGFTHRLNAQYKPNDDMMFYATWSRGFRPGGINRRAALQPYDSDFLTNYELGWKTTFGPVRWNGAVYHQIWKKFQFAFLGENSLTQIQNGRDARINGIETDVNYVRGGLTLTAAAAYTDAKTKDNICNLSFDEADDCDTFFPDPTPEDPWRRTRFHRHARGIPPARHAQIQNRRRPRAMHGPWVLAGPMCRPDLPTRARPVPTFGEISAMRRMSSTPTTSSAGLNHPPWSISLRASIGSVTILNCSPRTSSTSATSFRVWLSAASARRRRSCPAGRGRSDLRLGAKF